MIRRATRWPHRIGGLTFWSPDAGYWRRSGSGGKTWTGEGSMRGRRGACWLVGPGRDCDITWWRVKLRTNVPINHGASR